MSIPYPAGPMVASSAAAAFAALRARGMRVSSARRLLLEALYLADGPLTAEDLAGDGDVASVYRNLEVLERLGVVQHVHLGHGPARFLAARSPRELVLCELCGALDVLPGDALARVREIVLQAVGYRASFTHLPLPGRCPDCVKADELAAGYPS